MDNYRPLLPFARTEVLHGAYGVELLLAIANSACFDFVALGPLPLVN